jgi:8-oxo-dGTP diphosphatase
MSGDVLADEGIVGFRWWRLQDIAGYRGPELFSPRELATPLAALVAGRLSVGLVPLGL